jgi:hypothetical protein
MTLLTQEANYEFTPFRMEGNYSDFRHPKEISRTNNLLADSKRRDLTINARYTALLDIGSLNNAPKMEQPKQVLQQTLTTSRATFHELWNTHTTRYLPQYNLIYL